MSLWIRSIHLNFMRIRIARYCHAYVDSRVRQFDRRTAISTESYLKRAEFVGYNALL